MMKNAPSVRLTSSLAGCSPRGGAVWQLIGLITRRSWVQIPPPLPVKVQVRAGARAPALLLPGDASHGLSHESVTSPRYHGIVRGSKRELRAGLWEPRVSLGYDPATGKCHQVSKTFHGGARTADAALRDLVDQHAQGRTDGIGVTVSQLLDRWLEECERLDLSPTTIRNYRSQVNGTIRPRLGKIKLHQLTPKHLDDLYGTLKDAGKSPKTIRNVHAILSAALHQAVRWGWLRENIAEQAKPPRVSNRRVTAPAVDVVQQVIGSGGIPVLLRSYGCRKPRPPSSSDQPVLVDEATQTIGYS
jgi:hypothetical protein